jgi:hypothetical protein
MSLFESASLVVTPNGTKASKLYAIKPTDGSGDLTVTRATTATRVNSSGLISSVASNVPRLDYSNGSCPSILVEPQRTNLITYSEDTATWGVNQTPIITYNNAIAPNGTQTAEKLVVNSIDEGFFNFSSGSVTSGTTYTLSIFVKYISGVNNIIFGFAGTGFGGDNANVFNIQNGTIVSTHSGNTLSVQSFNNGWYRLICTKTATANDTGGFIIYGNQNSEIQYNLWGVQLEAGSYATSYIPTTSASVTRNADVISKTGISSLIGQTEGTIFVEEVYDATIANNGGLDDTLVSLTDGTSSNLISIFHYGLGIGNVLFFIRLSNVTQVAISTSTPTSGTYKIALAYKNNDVVGYINGVQIGTDTSATIPATSVITLVDPITTNAATKTVKRKNIAVWKNRLTNVELAQLTTI